eukprot:scaffold53346_cov51-Phaeocystis_antarctica.AAC.4
MNLPEPRQAHGCTSGPSSSSPQHSRHVFSDTPSKKVSDSMVSDSTRDSQAGSSLQSGGGGKEVTNGRKRVDLLHTHVTARGYSVVSSPPCRIMRSRTSSSRASHARPAAYARLYPLP